MEDAEEAMRIVIWNTPQGWLAEAQIDGEGDRIGKHQKTPEEALKFAWKIYTQMTDDPMCSACNGSGEGMHADTTCHTCHGMGSIKIRRNNDDL